MFISAEEWQLLSFFESEPARREPNESAACTDLTFRRAVGELQVTFTVHPLHKDFALTVERGATTLLDVRALSVFDIRYETDNGAEILEILLTPDQRLKLQLKPDFSLTGSLSPTNDDS